MQDSFTGGKYINALGIDTKIRDRCVNATCPQEGRGDGCNICEDRCFRLPDNHRHQHISEALLLLSLLTMCPLQSLNYRNFSPQKDDVSPFGSTHKFTRETVHFLINDPLSGTLPSAVKDRIHRVDSTEYDLSTASSGF